MFKKISIKDPALQMDLIARMTGSHYDGLVVQAWNVAFCLGFVFDEDGEQHFDFAFLKAKWNKSMLYIGSAFSFHSMNVERFESEELRMEYEKLVRFVTEQDVRDCAAQSGGRFFMCKNCGNKHDSVYQNRSSQNYCKKCSWWICDDCIRRGVSVCSECKSKDLNKKEGNQ